MTKKHTGRCLCGAITYTATGTPVIVAQCHCVQCRRLSGTGHTVGAVFASSNVVVSGDLGTFSYTAVSGSTVTKAFCANCGSPIFGKNPRVGDFVTVTLGSMDDAADLDIEVVIHTNERTRWDHLSDKVTSFKTQPDWTPQG